MVSLLCCILPGISNFYRNPSCKVLGFKTSQKTHRLSDDMAAKECTLFNYDDRLKYQFSCGLLLFISIFPYKKLFISSQHRFICYYKPSPKHNPQNYSKIDSQIFNSMKFCQWFSLPELQLDRRALDSSRHWNIPYLDRIPGKREW